MSDETQATVIKIAAVVTAMPRWVVALMSAEGLAMPIEWLPWWTIASAIFAAAMAIVEGLAFSFVFSAWRKSTGRASNALLVLAIVSAVIFIGVLAPYIAASVKHVTLDEMLTTSLALYAWSVCVAASTIAIVASVGYAQKARSAPVQVARPPQAVVQATVQPAQIAAQVVQFATFEDFARAQAARNGKGIMQVDEIVALSGRPRRTVYDWIARYKKSKESVK